MPIMDQKRFCSGCGKQLEDDMQFCPQCGKVVSGSNAEAELKERERRFTDMVMDNHRFWLVFLLAAYAIPAVVMGVVMFAESTALASSIYASPEFHDWVVSHGYTITEEEIKSYLTYVAGLVLGSGACAAVSLVCVYIRKYWIIAVATCVMAAMLCFWSLFGLLIGLLVAWQIFGSKPMFVNDSA